MDNYHENLLRPESTVPYGDDAAREVRSGCKAAVAGEDDMAPEPPPAGVGQNERRMQVRAYNFWASLLDDRPSPRIEDLISATQQDFTDHAVVLDFSQGVANPAITILGQKLAEECGVAGPIERLSDVPDRSLLSRITDHCMQILSSEAPIGFEAEFVNQRGKVLLYRGILLPFTGDGSNVQHIMGVINWKELADPLVTAGLRLELEIAAATAHPQIPNAKLDAWADGPAAAEPGMPGAEPPLICDQASKALAEELAGAREAVEIARTMEDHSRAALHAAIGRAWNLALLAQADPAAWRCMLAEAGLARRTDASLMAAVKLVFGTVFDKPRLPGIATVLAHAQRHGWEHGELVEILAERGGLKQIVADERELRRLDRASRADRRGQR